MKNSLRQKEIFNKEAQLTSYEGHGHNNSSLLLDINVDEHLVDSVKISRKSESDASKGIEGSLSSSSSSGCSSGSFTTTVDNQLAADHTNGSSSKLSDPSMVSSDAKYVNKDNVVFVSRNSSVLSNKKEVKGEKMKGELLHHHHELSSASYNSMRRISDSKGSRTSKRRSREDPPAPPSQKEAPKRLQVMMNSASMRKNQAERNDASKVNHLAAHHVEGETTMSEFSAFALRASLSLKLKDKDRKEADSGCCTKGGLKRSSTMRIIPSDDPQACCWCLTCSSCPQAACCPQLSSQKLVDKPIESIRLRALEPAESLRWRRTTIVGRKPPIKHHYQALDAQCQGRQHQMVGEKETDELHTVSKSKCVFSGVQRPRARKSLPVPPPVIPLYKEMALKLPLNTQESSHSSSVDFNTNECNGDGDGQVNMEAKVDDPSAERSHTKAASEWKETAQVNRRKDEYRENASPMEKNSRRHVIFPPPPAAACPKKSTNCKSMKLPASLVCDPCKDDIGNLRLYYHDNWQELHVQGEKRAAKRQSSQQASAQSCCRRLENESSGQLGASLLVASSDEVHYSSQQCCEQPTVSLNRRTAGKFLERIKLTFLANFNSNSQAAAARPSCRSGNQSKQQHQLKMLRDATSHEDVATLKQRQELRLTRIAHDPSQETQLHQTTSENNIYSAPSLPNYSNNAVKLGHSIYDTPELNTRPKPPLVTCKARPMASGNLTRPTIPPPPPPPELELERERERERASNARRTEQQLLAHKAREQSLAMRAKRRAHLNWKRTSSDEDRDCSTYTTTLRLEDKSVRDHEKLEGVWKSSESELELSSSASSSLLIIEEEAGKEKENSGSSSRKAQQRTRKAVKWAEDTTTKTTSGTLERSRNYENKVKVSTITTTIRSNRQAEKTSSSFQSDLGGETTAQTKVSFNPELGIEDEEGKGESAKHLVIKSVIDSRKSLSNTSSSQEKVKINSSNRSLASFASLVAAEAAESSIKKGHKTSFCTKQQEIIRQEQQLVSRQSVSNTMGSANSSPALPLPLPLPSPSPLTLPVSSSSSSSLSSSSTVTNLNIKKRNRKKVDEEQTMPAKGGTKCSANIIERASGSPSKMSLFSHKTQATCSAKIQEEEGEGESRVDETCNNNLNCKPLNLVKSLLLEPLQSSSKTNNQEMPPTSSVTSLKQHLNPMKDEDPLERRRKSIQDGDVFIYPTHYKDQNVCRKCSRDNRICSCNLIIIDKENEEKEREIMSTRNEPIKSKDEHFSVCSDAGIGCSKLVAQLNDETEYEPASASEKEREKEELKSVYKISIATASIDQRSNQLRLSMPKIIVSKRTSSPSNANSPNSSSSSCSKSVKSSSINNFTPIESSALPSPLNRNSRKHTSYSVRNSSATRVDSSQLASECTSSSNTEVATTTSSITSQESQATKEGRNEKKEAEEEEAVEVGRSKGVEALTSPIAMIDATPFPLNLDLSLPDSKSNSKLLINNKDEENHKTTSTFIPVEAKVTSILIGSPTRCQVLDLQTILPKFISSTSPLIIPSITNEETASSINNNDDDDDDDANTKITTKCDTYKSIGNRTLEDIIREEKESEEQLTCNLSVGDSIKITSTSFRVGSTNHITTIQSTDSMATKTTNSNNSDYTSIIPITATTAQSLSARRRKFPAKLSRQAIHEDEDDADEKSETTNVTLTNETANHIIIPATSSCQLLCSSSAESESQKDDESSASNNDVLEYSPILTSVRDYINNINTGELQVQTTTTTTTLSSGAGSQQSSLESGSDLQLLPTACLQGSLSGSNLPELLTTSNNNLLVSSPSLIQSHTTTSCMLNGEKSPLLSLCSSSHQSAALIASNSTSGSINFHTNGELDSPKKSIFDGASKDEILEYLADARERVPEILMAADDVMVIGENELIVVNQLEPNSPATPISIVESVEIINDKALDGTPLVTSLGETDTDSHPDQLKQHLQQMLCQQSDLIMSQFSSTDNNNTLDLSEELSVCEPSMNGIHAAYTSNSNRNPCLESSSTRETSLDTPLTMSTTGGDKYLENILRTDTTFDSIEDQSSIIGSCLMVDDHNNNKSIQEVDSSQSSVSKLCHVDSPHKIKATVKEAQDLIINTSYASTGFAARRNSTSLDGSSPSQISRDCAIKLMRVHQQRYSNRDSLSSQSSTPPSSTSPSSTSSSSSASSSASSNQTSGNCSAASTFYASSSLSCSSPLLALTSTSSSSVMAQIPLLLPPPNSSSPDNDNQSMVTTSVNISEKEPQDSSLYDSRTDGKGGSDSASSFRSPVEQEDSGLGSECSGRNSKNTNSYFAVDTDNINLKNSISTIADADEVTNKLSVIQDIRKLSIGETKLDSNLEICQANKAKDYFSTNSSTVNRFINRNTNTTNQTTSSKPTFTSSANLMSRSVHGHYATMNRLNNYFMNRNPLGGDLNETTIVDFQCLDCDQFIDVDQATMLHKSNELRSLSDQKSLDSLELIIGDSKEKLLTSDQLDRAYIAAMNGLPLCKSCEKKRVERKEIISEFVETELKYGRDLKIIYDEFYRPMQIAGLLGKEQINGVFLNLEELILVHCKFADRLQVAISEAHAMGDTDYNTLNIGRLFIESSEMLHAFESYCIRQGSAACLLARLAKEKELLRIFLRVSQMENTLLRRMNLAAFLMVPVQRVTKYPLLLNRLYKVTAYHHKDRELLRDAQLKVELHLEHINQQTKGVGATNKIWRRISNLSAPISNRRGLINAEDIGYIKLRKTAMDMLKWDRDETQFIHSGKLNFAPLNEFLTKQKMKPTTMRYIAAHALLIVLGKPNWKYRPDLVKSNLDSKLMTPTPGGTGIKETALLLFREKNGRFIPCREPLLLSNCVLSADCSQFNSECPASLSTMSHSSNLSKAPPLTSAAGTTVPTTTTTCTQANGTSNNKKLPTATSNKGGQHQLITTTATASDCFNATQQQQQTANKHMDVAHSKSHPPKVCELSDRKSTGSSQSDAVSMVSIKSLPEERLTTSLHPSSPPLPHTSRSNSLASSLPPNNLTHHHYHHHHHHHHHNHNQSTNNNSSTSSLTTKSSSSSTSSNLTIINQFMTKVNNYHNKQQQQQQQQQQHDNNKSINSATSSQLDHMNANSTTGVTCKPTTNATIITTTSISVASQNQYQTVVKLDQQQQNSNNKLTANVNDTSANLNHQPHYNHLLFHNHHQPYGDYEESFEIHERLTKESMLLRADTPLKTRYWLQMLRYHAKDLGQWRTRRNGLANIMMMMRQESSS